MVIVLVLTAIALVAVIAPTPASTGTHGLQPAASESDRGVPVDAATFSPGACVAFGPTAGDRHQTVFLDAGHGGIDPGGVGTTTTGQTVEEADDTLPVEMEAMAILRAKGFRVVVSRTRSSTVVRLRPQDVSEGVLSLEGAHADVAARAVCADESGAGALVGIYFDAGGSPQNAGSITAYDADRPFSAANLTLADLLQHDVVEAMNAQGWGIPDDGVVSDTAVGSLSGDPVSGGLAAEAQAYGHLLLLGPAMTGFFSTPSAMPGAVIEPLYVTDPFEASIANSARGQAVIARGVATAVVQFLSPSPRARPATTG